MAGMFSHAWSSWQLIGRLGAIAFFFFHLWSMLLQPRHTTHLKMNRKACFFALMPNKWLVEMCCCVCVIPVTQLSQDFFLKKRAQPLLLSGTHSYYGLYSLEADIWRAERHSVSPVDPELCDICFLPAGCCHFNTSLHPHILTFCKHVWLYQLTFLPSGCSTQAECKLTVCPQETLVMPTSIFTTLFPIAHYYCHILFSPSLVKGLLRAGDLTLFCHIRAILVSLIFLVLLPLKCRGMNIKP